MFVEMPSVLKDALATSNIVIRYLLPTAATFSMLGFTAPTVSCITYRYSSRFKFSRCQNMVLSHVPAMASAHVGYTVSPNLYGVKSKACPRRVLD